MGELVSLDFADPIDFERWQKFIHGREDTHCADLPQWRLIFHDLYGIESHTFGYVERAELVGGVSVYHVKSPLLGNMLVSCPFFGRGGLYADSAEARQALLQRIEQLAGELRVDFIELRLMHSLPPPFQTNTDFLEFDLELPGSLDAVWQQCLSSNARQNLRKAEKNNLRFAITADHASCFDLLFQTIRDLGTPFHSKRLFELMVQHLPDHVSFSEVRAGDRLIAGGVVIRFKDSVITPFIGSLKEHRGSGSNYQQYWGIIRYCFEHDVKRFDLGRSRCASTHVAFKEKWGAVRKQAHYNYQITNPRSNYATVGKPSRLQVLGTEVWKRLPLFITRPIGPSLARYIP